VRFIREANSVQESTELIIVAVQLRVVSGQPVKTSSVMWRL
jgi:hypothetical protein